MMRFGMSALTCVALSFSGASHGQTIDDFTPVQKVTASDGAEYADFGHSVSISGDLMVAGALYARIDSGPASGSQTGSAYIFEQAGDGTWSEVAQLFASDAWSSDFFGRSVSISGDLVVVGASGNDDNGTSSGSAYIFEQDGKGTWSEVAKLTASDAVAGAIFGYSVSISGDLVVVGASGNDDNGISSGSAYIYERDGNGAWSEVAKLNASDGNQADLFGSGVSISGDTVVVGSYLDDDNGFDSGSAYIYERAGDGTWPEVAKLTASDPDEYDEFGFSVSISGDRVVVGADYDDDNGSASGSAYIFERNGKGTWSEVAKLTASDAAVSDRFGGSVAISGDLVLVGARLDDDNGWSNSGSAYVYERDGKGTWSEMAKLTASDGAENDWFGYSVSISDNQAVIGSKFDNDNGTASGSAYIYGFGNVINLDNENKLYLGLVDAIEEANPNDRLAVQSKAFAIDGILNTTDMPLNFIAAEPIEFGSSMMFLPADNTSFIDSDDVDEAGYFVSGSLVGPDSGELIFSNLSLAEGGELVQNNASLYIHEGMSNESGTAYLAGNIFGGVGIVATSENGTNRIARDTDIYGDYTNAGSTIIQRGILYIYGDLTNTGTLSGDYNNGFTGGDTPEPGDGFNISGSYTIGQDATLSMPNPVWWLRVGGNLDIAIDDPANFGMSEATIELNGLAAGKVQAFEAMSADLGADEAGFDSSNFPIGTLRITGNSNTQLVNSHANSTGGACEVVYVNELVIESGGSLATGGCTIYTRSATINGEVDDPDSIVIIDEQPPCPGDLNNDGTINGADLGLIIAMWGTADGDLTGDGTTNGADLGLLIAGWGLCN